MVRSRDTWTRTDGVLLRHELDVQILPYGDDGGGGNISVDSHNGLPVLSPHSLVLLSSAPAKSLKGCAGKMPTTVTINAILSTRMSDWSRVRLMAITVDDDNVARYANP